MVRVGLDGCLVRPQISLVAPSTVEELRRVVLVLKGSLLHAALVSMLLIFGSPPQWCNEKTELFFRGYGFFVARLFFRGYFPCLLWLILFRG